MTLSSLAGAAVRRLLPLIVASCGAWVGELPATGASSTAHVTFLPATSPHHHDGALEVMPAPSAGVRPVGRLHAPRLGASRMVLAGAGLPLPASGPGRLFLSPLQPATGATLLLSDAEPPPGFITRFGSGDPLVLEFAPGEAALFRVTRVHVITDPESAPLAPGMAHDLVLVTQVPASQPGDPVAYYIVVARPVAVEHPL